MAAESSSSAYFEPGSAVEVSTDGGLFSGLWFPGKIINRVSERFLIKYRKSNVREFVSFHRLRPPPPPESHREFESGDKVELLFNGGCWKGHVTDRHRFINNWLPLVTKPATIRVGGNGTKEKENIDRISELPDSVLLNIMNLMETKSAVRTCVLSKRWKHLCKGLTNLAFYSRFTLSDSNTLRRKKVLRFRKFVFWVLFIRDGSYSLLDLAVRSCVEPQDLNSLIKYAVFHNVQHLTLELQTKRFPYNFESLPLIFRSRSLTSLKLSISREHFVLIPTNSLHLPALKNLHLQYVLFPITKNNDCIDPFSNCHVLNTLVLENFSLHVNARSHFNPMSNHTLWISNHTLSSLRIKQKRNFKLLLSTPNLSSFSVENIIGHQLSTTCNLSFLERVNLDVEMLCRVKNSCLIAWLQVLANVKKLTLSSATLQIILEDLSNPSSIKPQPPCFVRLKSLKVKKDSFADISDEEVNTAAEYLLQNSPMAKVNISDGS